MHKFAFTTVMLASLALPGCIFAVGTEGWDDGDDDSCCGECAQMTHAEKRLSVLEHHAKGDCKAECPLCKKADAKPEPAAAK
jgi:hypothetical protein